jgi:hypothetical protein
MLKSLLLACAVAATATSLQAQSADTSLNGEWKFDAERILIRMQPDTGGTIAGTILQSPVRSDVGRILLRIRRVELQQSAWRGQIFRPDNGTTVGAAARLSGSDTLIVVAKKFMLSRTLIFTRTATTP